MEIGDEFKTIDGSKFKVIKIINSTLITIIVTRF